MKKSIDIYKSYECEPVEKLKQALLQMGIVKNNNGYEEIEKEGTLIIEFIEKV